MRLLFFGSPGFAIPSLQALHQEEELEIQAVVTPPDRPAGRGHAYRAVAVKEEAKRLGLSLLEEEDVNQGSFLERVKGMKLDALVVVAFGQFLKGSLLSIPKYGCINLHGSLLPQYRGAAPIQWALIKGSRETGVTTILLDEGMDSGDILLRERVTIGREETAGELQQRLAPIGAKLLVKTLLSLKANTIDPVPQDEKKATFAPRLTPQDSCIDWKKGALEIHNLIRGTNPYPGAHTLHHGKRVKLLRSHLVDDTVEGKTPGELLYTKGENLICATGKGILAIEILQPAGKKKMSGQDYYHGYCSLRDSWEKKTNKKT